jgi:hypothetical protein
MELSTLPSSPQPMYQIKLDRVNIQNPGNIHSQQQILYLHVPGDVDDDILTHLCYFNEFGL